MNETLHEFIFYGQHIIVTPWKIVGLIGILLFTGRWFVQAYYSREAGRPVTPRIFWLMSISGSLILLSYFIFSAKQDMVGVMSNLFPCVISGYNLYLDLTHAKKTVAAEQRVQQEKSAEEREKSNSERAPANSAESDVPNTVVAAGD